MKGRYFKDVLIEELSNREMLIEFLKGELQHSDESEGDGFDSDYKRYHLLDIIRTTIAALEMQRAKESPVRIWVD